MNNTALIQIEDIPLCPFNFIPLTRGKITKVDREDYIEQGRHNWHTTCKGYAARNVPKPTGRYKLTFMHRILMNAPDGMDVDHIDHDPLNNQRSNLRICSRAENMANRKRNSNNNTGFKGVQKRKGYARFRATIQVQKKRVNLGDFTTAEEAHEAYKAAATQHYGEFANFGTSL